MDNNLNNVFAKFSEMMNNGDMPENVKGILQNMVNSQNTNTNLSNSNNFESNNCCGNNNAFSSKEHQPNNSKKNNQSNTKNSNNSSNFTNSSNSSNFVNQSDSNYSNIFNNIDINTIFKLQNAMNSINSDKQNESRTNLLLSLKPYLKESRRSKIDQYIQLFKMEKVFEIMNPLGGDKKNV